DAVGFAWLRRDASQGGMLNRRRSGMQFQPPERQWPLAAIGVRNELAESGFELALTVCDPLQPGHGGIGRLYQQITFRQDEKDGQAAPLAPLAATVLE